MFTLIFAIFLSIVCLSVASWMCVYECLKYIERSKDNWGNLKCYDYLQFNDICVRFVNFPDIALNFIVTFLVAFCGFWGLLRIFKAYFIYQKIDKPNIIMEELIADG